MTVNYKGRDKDFEYRLAEINFNDDEDVLMERIASLMKIKGYSIDIVTDGYAQCEVDSFDEYKEFVKDYREAKKCIRNCLKFGF